MSIIQTKQQLLNFIRSEIVNGKNLSIRGVAKCCEVADKSIINGGSFNSQRLGQIFVEQGFSVGSLIQDGFSPQAVWLCIEYFAYESKAEAGLAKQLARTFGSLGIKETFAELTKESLEKQFQPIASIKEIDQAYDFYRKVYGEAYAYRYAHQQMKKHQPHLAGDEPPKEERPSLPVKILLTPTQIAAKLNILYSTNNPNPRAVNKLLQKLGYQTLDINGWNPTQKAIDAQLVDRKPVDTNSQTQKDQLLWSEDIIDILKEFSIS